MSDIILLLVDLKRKAAEITPVLLLILARPRLLLATVLEKLKEDSPIPALFSVKSRYCRREAKAWPVFAVR